TASTEEKTLKMAYEVGGVDYITKPFNTTELLARVSTQLDLVDKTYNLQNLISKQLEEIRNKDALLIEQSKKAEMGQMIATITHQLKQPLNVVSALMSSALIDDMLGKNVDIDRIGLKVQDEITFMSETIDMYRTFFSTNQEKRYTSLSKVVDDTLYIMTGNIIDVTFIKEYQENLEMIKVYKNELIQCVMNIIKNAQDNQNEKKISTYKDGDYQVITIHDNGGGIPSNIKDKIFNNYFTTKSEDNGTGIGLYLVKQIIEEKHNGQVYVENQELEYNSDRYMGAKFFIKLREDNE
ncbi:MAG: hybrid sensor histidine kinase/response regulator, partial [Campylobacterales bacterium]